MEGQLHKLLKETVAKELENQNFKLYYEPSESPLNRVSWYSYRPDILGICVKNSTLQIMLVECETKPNQKRILEKTSQIKKVFSLQKQLWEYHKIIPILAIPVLNLYKVNCTRIRKFWEIWIVNQSGRLLHKIFRRVKETKL
jgi:hypothetical protein